MRRLAGAVSADDRTAFGRLPRKRKLMAIAGIAIGLAGVVGGVAGLVRIHVWDTTVSHATCAVTRVSGPEQYGKSQEQWLVKTADCGLLTITAGNPGYPFSGGQKLAAELSDPGRYRLTLHGWGDHRDVVAASHSS